MTDVNDQVKSYLSDAHAIEEQALAQLRSAPKIAGDDQLAAALTDHLAETERHEELVRDRLDMLGDSPSWFKDVVLAAGGKGFVLFARAQPDTPGKLAAHAYSYEHLEVASYELLARVAAEAGDQETVQMAERIGAEERRMGERLEGLFDSTVDSSLEAIDPDDLAKQVAKYLEDAHALEQQAVQLLEGAVKAAGDPQLESAYVKHLQESRQHRDLVAERLEALGESPSALKDAALRLGAINWSTFFSAHPDTPGKLAAFSYAFEHLEIAGYEQLKRVAAKAGDSLTVAVAERILGEERGAAEAIALLWDQAVKASLRDVGIEAGTGTPQNPETDRTVDGDEELVV